MLYTLSQNQIQQSQGMLSIRINNKAKSWLAKIWARMPQKDGELRSMEVIDILVDFYEKEHKE